MQNNNAVTVEQFFKEHGEALQMKLVAGEKNLNRFIREPTVNRPGLALAGFTRYFAYKRIQVMGNAEAHFLKTLNGEEREKRYGDIFRYRIPGMVFSRNLHPDKLFLKAAEAADIPIFTTPLITMKFIN